MTEPTIRTTCPHDGAVDMKPIDVEIAEDEMSYTFMCPKCHEAIIKGADLRIIALLKGAGVKVETPAAPPITNRDILLFESTIDQELKELLG